VREFTTVKARCSAWSVTGRARSHAGHEGAAERRAAVGAATSDATSARTQLSTQLPSVTLPPPLERVLRDYEGGWQARDASARAALFADDGFVLQPGKPPVRGKDAIRQAYGGDGGGALRLRALAYATDGSVGYVIGADGYGDQPGDAGKFTLTLQRGAYARWMVRSDMDNGNVRSRAGERALARRSRTAAWNRVPRPRMPTRLLRRCARSGYP
jgi:ketosteroid isomerase-like protein